MIRPYGNDVDALRRAFSGFPTGVAALAAVVDREPTVLISSSFTVGVSLDPPLVLTAVQRSSTTWPLLAGAPRIGVTILSEKHADKCRQLASKDKAIRFAGLQPFIAESGAVFLDGAPACLECTIDQVYPAGDHELIILRVHGLMEDFSHSPLIWHRSAFTTLSQTA
jgi:flavin reductase (DIM6/NTAB) family NADH-FMN oxidoreductase RutF